MLVEEFTNVFDRLRICCDVVEEEEETIARYLAGLKLEITHVVCLQQYWSYNDVCRGGISTSKRCYKCQGLRHFANDCPNKKMVTFVEENFGPEFDEYDEEHEKMTSDHKEITYVTLDTGEVLPRQGADVNEEEHRPNRRDQRDLEIAAQGRRIRELERMLAQARLENFRDVDRDDEGSQGSDIDSTESNNEEDENPKGKPKIVSWEKMKKKLMAKFLPVQYKQEAFIEYHNFKQSGGMLVKEFTNEFDRLRLRCDVVEEEEETIAHYLTGLKPEITDVVCLQQYWSYNDVCRLARKVESQQKRKINSNTNSRFLSRFTGTNTGKKVASSSSNPTRNSSTTSTYNPNSSRGDMGDDVDINMPTMEQYLALIQDNIRPGIVKPEINNDVGFEINGNFMRELRRKLFKGIDEEDCVPYYTHRAALRWKNRLSAGLITTWDLLEKTFIKKYCPPFNTAMKLEKIRNFKQEMDETLYHAWERYNDLLFRLIMEYFVKISKKARILELKRRNLKKTILTSNTPYPSKKKWSICACTLQETTKNKVPYTISRRIL
ncbi:RNA-directed DNA polymerase [Tanacetum coccineum]